jgi:phosphoglycolate phosphatase
MRAILFDKDGTLLDFEATWSPILKALALEAAEGEAGAAAALLELGGFEQETGTFRAASVLAAGTSRSIVELWYPGLSGDAFAEAVVRMDRAFHGHGVMHSVPVEGVAETLALLAGQGFVMGVATNDATLAARASLDALGMARHLPHVFGYDSVPRPKPAADLVLAFAAATGIAPADIAVVGDNAHDIEMARAAGAGLAIGVLSGNSGREHLAPIADGLIESVRDLPDWLHQNRK